MVGGAGDDIYYVNSAGDLVVENAGEGLDTVRTEVSDVVLPSNVENLELLERYAFRWFRNRKRAEQPLDWQ